MAIKFEIVGNNLVLTNTETSSVVFDELASETTYVSSKLDDGIIQVAFPIASNKNPSQAFGSIIRYSVDASAATDANDVTFTADTFREFARNNLGNSGISSSLSISNSSSTPLDASATFTGTAELNSSPSVLVFVATDQDGTLYCEFSIDGTNWDTSLSFNYRTNRINPPHVFEKGYRYFRVRFTNTSSSNQTYFRLSTSYSSYQKLTAPINSTLAESYDATVVRPTDYKYEVAEGKRQGRATWNKFGFNLDGAGATDEIIAAYGGSFDPTTDIMTTAQTFTVAYNNTTDGSGTTGALSLLFTYIDANFDLVTGTHTLGSTGSDTTSFTGLGINRVVVLSNGGLGWNVNDITITATSDGTTQASLPALGSVTQQCIFHTPINHNFLADWARFKVLKLAGGTAPRGLILGYSWSRVTQTRYLIFREPFDTNVENTIDIYPSQPFVIGGREVLWFELDTNTNNTEINGRFSGVLQRVS